MPDRTLLSTLLPDTPLRCFEETGSTNSDARTWLLAGADHGSLVIADRQSSGRGRMGRAFSSANGGLYMSLIVKSEQPAGVLTTLCAVAVREAVIRLTGFVPSIKWVNDLILNDRKICGILCESVWLGDRLLGTVAGIGLNVCQTEFPAPLRGIAASLYPDGHSPVPPERFAAEITREILTLLPAAPAHMAAYRAACLTLGQAVQWEKQGAVFQGRAADVDDTGALLIDTPQGRIALAAGEVSLRRAD